MLINLVELTKASEWANKHSSEKHANDPWPPRFHILQTGDAGIGTVFHVLCESCDDKKVSRDNYFDISDYENW